MADRKGEDDDEIDLVVVERRFSGGLIVAVALVVFALLLAHLFGLIPI